MLVIVWLAAARAQSAPARASAVVKAVAAQRMMVGLFIRPPSAGHTTPPANLAPNPVPEVLPTSPKKTQHRLMIGTH